MPPAGGRAADSAAAGLGGRQPAAVTHALEVLEAVARLGPGVTAQQIADQLHLSPSTAYRLVNLLVAEEYIVRLPDLSGFALGRRALDFAGAAAPPSRLPRRARRTVERLRDATRFGVHVVGFANGRPHLIDADPDRPPPRGVGLDEPTRAAMMLVEAEREESIRPRIVRSPTDSGDGVGSIASAVRDESDGLVAAIVVLGPADRIRAQDTTIAPLLLTAAEELGDLLS
jgi:DNA-binding IclR family transcriptional regulator